MTKNKYPTLSQWDIDLIHSKTDLEIDLKKQGYEILELDEFTLTVGGKDFKVIDGEIQYEKSTMPLPVFLDKFSLINVLKTVFDMDFQDIINKSNDKKESI